MSETRQELFERWAEDYRAHARKHASAAAEYERLSQMTKVVKARIMQSLMEGGLTSIAAQEREAYAAPEYETHLRRLAKSREHMEWLWGELEIKRRGFDFWRTTESTKREEMRFHTVA